MLLPVVEPVPLDDAPICVEVGVIEGVEVPLPVALAVGVLLSEDELVALPVFVLLGVLEELEP